MIMKKTIISAFALLAMIMSSCNNEDITIEAPSTIITNAAGVIAPFTWQYDPGELETFGSNYKLRVRSLVYNERGELVKKATEFFSNYNVQLKTSEFLSAGTYTIIGVSDVVKASGNSVSFEFWELSGEEKLSDLKLKDKGYIGLFAKILGVGKNTLTIRESQSNSVDVDLKPAGSLVYTFFYNRDALSRLKVTNYQLLANKIGEAVSLDGSGNTKVIENNDGSTEFIIADTDAEAGGEYSYNFLLPMSNLKLWFVALIDGEEYTFETDEGVIFDCVAGEEYLCELKLNSDISEIETSYLYANKARNAYTRSIDWGEKWQNRMGLNTTNIDKKMPKSMYNYINTTLTFNDIK